MPPLDRRTLLISATAAAFGAVPAFSGCTDSESPFAPASFEHGVASGDPLPDAVILWTRATPLGIDDTQPADPMIRIGIDWWIARDPALLDVVRSGQAVVDGRSDWTLKLDVNGLQPGQTYWYGFAAGSARSVIGRVRTAPVGTVEALSFGVVTCANYAAGLFHAYRRVAERDTLQAVIHLGDYLYENGRQDGVRPQIPARETVTLADYRSRYRTHRRDGDLQALHAAHAMIWIWDDHEVVNNAWRDGAEDHDEATEGPYAERRAAAFRAAHEWLPIRSPNPDDLSVIYRSFRFGDLADLVMLDARHVGRDAPLAPNGLLGNLGVFSQTGEFANPQRQILGDAQERWLEAHLAGRAATSSTGIGASTMAAEAPAARWQLFGNPVYFSPLKLLGTPRSVNGGGLYVSPDKWDGYAPARDRVLALLRQVRNPVILTGDAHEAYAFDITDDPNGPGYDPRTGDGAQGVEFVVTSISSRGDLPDGDSLSGRLQRLAAGLEDSVEQLLRVTNPHLRYFNNRFNGYTLIHLTPAHCTAEFWTVPAVTRPTDQQALDAVWRCADGTKRLLRERS